MTRKLATFAISLLVAIAFLVACARQPVQAADQFTIAYNGGTGDQVYVIDPAPLPGVHQLHIALVESPHCDFRWEAMKRVLPYGSSNAYYTDATFPFILMFDARRLGGMDEVPVLIGIGVPAEQYHAPAYLESPTSVWRGRSYAISYSSRGDDLNEYVFKVENGKVYFAKA